MKIILAPCLPVTQSEQSNLKISVSTQFPKLKKRNKKKTVEKRNWKSILSDSGRLVYWYFNSIWCVPFLMKFITPLKCASQMCVLYYNQARRRKRSKVSKKKRLLHVKAIDLLFSHSPRFSLVLRINIVKGTHLLV